MTVCPFCAGTRLEKWARAPHLFLLCCTCGVAVRADAISSGVSDLDYHGGAGESNESAETPFSLLHGFAHTYIRPALSDGALLDYGTGSGKLLKILSDAGIPAYGLDQSPIARRKALELYGIPVAASFNGLPRETWSVASAFEVIEHIPNLRWLKIIFDKLRSGGSIFITTPNRDSLAALMSGERWAQLTNPYHIALFNARALSRILELIGFKNIRVVRYGPVLGRNSLFSVGHRVLLVLNRHSILRMAAVKP